VPWGRRARARRGNAPSGAVLPEKDIVPRTLPPLKARRLRPIATVLVVSAALVLIFQFGLLGPARHLGLVPEPQQFTELAFAAPAALPSSAVPGSPLALTFVITNEEGKSYTYHWDATLREGQITMALSAGEVTVAASKSAQVPFVFVPKRVLTSPAEISIALAHSSEQLTVHLSRGA